MIRRHWTRQRHPVSAVHVAGEATDLTDHPLPGEADHEGGAVVALQRGAECPDQELVGLGFGADLETGLEVWQLLCLGRRVGGRGHHSRGVVASHGGSVVLENKGS